MSLSKSDVEFDEKRAVSDEPYEVVEQRDEKRLYRQARLRIDVLVLGFLLLMFIHLQLDRTNLGNALTDGFASDMGMAQNKINVGQTLFTLSIVIFELPGNVVVKAMGAHRWLPTIMMAWGGVTMCQAALVNRSGYYATRFILGMCEAGAWKLTRLFTRRGILSRSVLRWR